MKKYYSLFNYTCTYILYAFLLLFIQLANADKNTRSDKATFVFKNPYNHEHELFTNYIIHADRLDKAMHFYRSSFSLDIFTESANNELGVSTRLFLFVSAVNQEAIKMSLDKLTTCKSENSPAMDSKEFCLALKHLLTTSTRPFITRSSLKDNAYDLFKQSPQLSRDLVERIYENRFYKIEVKTWYSYDLSILDDSLHNSTTLLQNQLVISNNFIQDWTSTAHELSNTKVKNNKQTDIGSMKHLDILQHTLNIINNNYLSLYNALNKKLDKFSDSSMIIALMSWILFQKPGGGLWQSDNLLRQWVDNQPDSDTAIKRIHNYRQFMYFMADAPISDLYYSHDS